MKPGLATLPAAMTTASLEALIARAEGLLARLEAVLPHPAAAPDWTASHAFRARRRHGALCLEPVRAVSRIRLADLQEV